jgi:hypothetical protein
LRVITPQALLRKFDRVRVFLATTLQLTPAQREAVFRLLRLWAYYGKCYPKEAQITKEPGCSKATFWRTISTLEALSMVVRVNRYVKREHAQISNLYLLDKLILAIAKYLSEHGYHFNQPWLKPLFEITWPDLWNMRCFTAYEAHPPPVPA